MEPKKKPKVFRNTRLSVSQGSGFYLNWAILDQFSTADMQGCFRQCIKNGRCRSFSYSTITSKCYLNYKINDGFCATVKENGFQYFEVT